MPKLRITVSLVLLALILAACSSSNSNGESMHEMHHGGNKESIDKTMDVEAIWSTTPSEPRSTDKVNVSVQFKDASGMPIENYDINHEKLLHLIVVSRDLSQFQHLHPEYNGDGTFNVQTDLPKGGDYKFIADFIPSGGSQMIKSNWVTVSGDQSNQSIEPDANLTKVIEGKRIKLSFDELKANQEVEMTFSFSDEKSNEPINDLEPYLGAVGHVVIISEDAELYIHNHPSDEKAKGPDARFMTEFPKAGVYKIWGQFQHNGKVITVPFVIKVPK